MLQCNFSMNRGQRSTLHDKWDKCCNTCGLLKIVFTRVTSRIESDVQQNAFVQYFRKNHFDKTKQLRKEER